MHQNVSYEPFEEHGDAKLGKAVRGYNALIGSFSCGTLKRPFPSKRKTLVTQNLTQKEASESADSAIPARRAAQSKPHAHQKRAHLPWNSRGVAKTASPTAGGGGPGGVGEAGGSAAPTREKRVSGAGGLKAAPYAVTTGCRLHDWIAPTRRGGLQPAPGKRDPPAGAGPRPPPTQALG